MAIPKNIVLVDGYDTGKIKIINETGTLLKNLPHAQAGDGVCWDPINEKLWFNREDSTNPNPTNNYIYKIDKYFALESSFQITPPGGEAYELEGVCYDPSDNSLWVVNDEATNPATPTLGNRSISDGSIIGSAIDLGALTGPQGLCYDTSDDTFWIMCNDTDKLYNVTKSGVHLSSFDIDTDIDASLAGSLSPQCVAYDDRDDTLWFCSSINSPFTNGYIYHITKTGTLINRIDSPYSTTPSSNGPTGIALIPTWLLSQHTPYFSMRMYDESGTYVATQYGLKNDQVGATASHNVTGLTQSGGVIDKYFQFNGSTHYIDFGEVVLPKAGYTISMWVNPDDITGSIGTLLGTAANTDWLRFNTDNTLTLRANWSTDVLTVSAPYFSDDSWQHLVLAKTGATTVDVWRNGEKIGDGLSVTDKDFTPEFVGQKASDGWYDGGMSNLLFYSYPLSDTEIAWLYNNGNGRDTFSILETDGAGRGRVQARF